MNYAFYIIVILSIVAIVVLPFAIKRKLQKSFFAQIAIRNIIKVQPLFFCSYTFCNTKIILYLCKPKNNNKKYEPNIPKI
jgi:hypothetical protein